MYKLCIYILTIYRKVRMKMPGMILPWYKRTIEP